LLAFRQVVDDDGCEALSERCRERGLEPRLGLELLGQRRSAERLWRETAHQRFALDLELGSPSRSRVGALAPEAALRARLVELALQALYLTGLLAQPALELRRALFRPGAPS